MGREKRENWKREERKREERKWEQRKTEEYLKIALPAGA
jgi:hypothetical protein